VEISPKFGDENLCEKFSAEMEYCKIDPWAGLAGNKYRFQPLEDGQKGQPEDGRVEEVEKVLHHLRHHGLRVECALHRAN
jgi:hypothetical protein